MKHTICIILAAVTSVWVSSSAKADLLYHSLAKTRYFHQEGGSAPTLRPYRPWAFEPRLVFTNDARTIIPVMLTRPGFFFETILFSASGLAPSVNLYDGTRRYAQQTDLDAQVPNGDYTFNIQQFSLPALVVSNSVVTGTFPEAPTVTNLVEAQSIDAASDFTLGWNAFSEGTTNDLIICSLKWGASNVVQTAIMPGLPGALDGTATSLLIPAGTLQPGRAYLGRLIFASVKSVITNQPLGVMMYQSQTDFYIKTTGVGDNTVAAVVSMFPAPGENGVPKNTSLMITFTKPTGSRSVSEIGQVLGSLSSMYWSPDGLSLGGGLNNFASDSAQVIVVNPLPNASMYDSNGTIFPPDITMTFTTGEGYHPSVTSVLANAKLDETGHFQADLLGETNRGFGIQYSTNLVDWTGAGSGFTFDGTFHIDSPIPRLSHDRLFFRAVTY